MTETYEEVTEIAAFLKQRAKAAEAVVRESEDARRVLTAKANQWYEHALVMLESVVTTDEACAHEAAVPDRAEALNVLLSFLELVEQACLATRPEEQGYDASARKARQMIELVRLMLEGGVVYDSGREKAAIEAFQRGETITLGEFRRRLRDPHP